jgi:dolichol kinase
MVAGVAVAMVCVGGMIVSDAMAGITGRRAALDRWERWEAQFGGTE